MQVSVDVHQNQHTGLQCLLALANAAAALGPDMRVPEIEGRVIGNKAQPQSSTPEFSSLDREAQKDAAVLSIEKLRQKYGQQRADKAIAVVQSQVPTARGAFTKYHQQEREAKRELGKGLAAAGVEVKQHTVQDYTRIILAQLDSFLEGVILSDSALLRIAFPDDPAKAKSIGNSRNGKRYKQAWGSPAVMNHPMEKAMQRTHNRHDMNRRLTARTFGQSLSMNAVLFKSSDRDNKQDAEIAQLKREVAHLKQQMQEPLRAV